MKIDEQLRLVASNLDRLMQGCDPAHDDPAALWGAQFDLGLAWVNFPHGSGGLEVDPQYQRLVDEALGERGFPSNLYRNLMGVGMAAPTIIEFGTTDHLELLRPAFTCDDIWCQLFSEPSAGSDLAGLSTRALRDGDEWVVNGQKVWTTLAHIARWGLLLARTDTEVPKHQGLTFFIVDMQAPGVEVRPLRQLTGDAEYNEVFFTDVRIADSERLGPVGEGWRVALTTLANERVTIGGTSRRPRGMGPIGRAVDLWHARSTSIPGARDLLARYWIEAEVLRLTAIRAEEARERGTPGVEGSILKLATGLTEQRIYDFCLTLLGADGMLISNYDLVQPTSVSPSLSDPEADLVKAFLTIQCATIGGGTTAIMRSLIGERVLGLPGDIRVDRTLPWSQIPR
ncbi:MAG TPA: acyl-CoA dehydrogenase family protein [Acidimicrobiales bacterium]|jgi:alkylation response protein AidB-like acyl-CoA dehydrogenase|nr:acyl-CoA dehydrogenase family protein [Acidimicrobiales bacterium]